MLRIVGGLGSPSYDTAKQVVELLAQDDFWSATALLAGLSPVELAMVADKAIALGANPDTVKAMVASLGKTEVIEVVGTAPGRPWWHYALGLAAVAGVGLLAYKAFKHPSAALGHVLRTGPFYYLDYREALRRAKQLASEAGRTVHVSAGVDSRKPERTEYAVALVGESPYDFHAVSRVTRDGEVKSTGSRYHRMMERRGE